MYVSEGLANGADMKFSFLEGKTGSHPSSIEKIPIKPIFYACIVIIDEYWIDYFGFSNQKVCVCVCVCVCVFVCLFVCVPALCCVSVLGVTPFFAIFSKMFVHYPHREELCDYELNQGIKDILDI